MSKQPKQKQTHKYYLIVREGKAGRTYEMADHAAIQLTTGRDYQRCGGGRRVLRKKIGGGD